MAKTLRRQNSKPKAKKTRKSAESRTNERDPLAVTREANRRLDVVDREMDRLRDQRKIIVNTLIKGELGMRAGDFMAARRVAQMDPGIRAGLFVAIRQQFESTKEGDTVDFLKVQEEMDKKVVADITSKLDQTEEAAEAQGYECAMSSASMADQPYPVKSKLGVAWDTGFKKGLVERLETGKTGQQIKAAAT